MSANEPSGPYHAGPGTAHEVGVMVGFMAAFVLIASSYLILWKLYLKRSEAKEVQRRHVLAEKTNPRNTRVMDEKAGDRSSAAPGY